jgi:hypothetical protein
MFILFNFSTLDEAKVSKNIFGFSGANDSNTNIYFGFGKAL